MDCRTCQPTLLDLAYGELAPELASVVRAHVDGCESCGAALRALREGIDGAQQLAWLEPPPRLHENAMAYATQHGRERAEAAAAKSAAKQRGAFGQGLVELIARLASGRQVAMATVMVLVVAVGVWVIPELQPLPEGQGVTVVSPDPAGEAAPSAGLAPAEPLDLKVDARSGRIRSREEIEAAKMARAASEASAAAEAYAALEEPAAPSPPPPAEELQGELAAKSNAARRAAPRDLGRDDLAGEQRAPRGPKAFPESDGDDLLALGPSSGMRSRAADEAMPKTRPSSKGASIDELLEGAAAPSPTQASESKRKSSSEPRADAVSVLERARSVRSTDGCATALPVYEQAVSDYSRAMPQSSVLGAALIELAECQWQLGRDSSARATLKRAEQIAPVAVRARAMLESDVAASAPAATAAEAEAPAAKPAAPVRAASPSKD
jgi:hypothetical protein